MMQQDELRDYILATGESHSVREFAQKAFAHVGLNYEDWIEIDERLYRPAEVDYPQADPSQTFELLDWRPRHSFDDLVREMVENDCTTGLGTPALIE